jgi:hypothetical protein
MLLNVRFQADSSPPEEPIFTRQIGLLAKTRRDQRQWFAVGFWSGGVDRLDAVVHGPQGVFVSFTRFGRLGVRVVLFEVGGVPVFHGDHRVVGSG